MSHSIILMGVWFGPWPAWIDFFFLSCRANKDIDWLVFSDQAPPESTPHNVKIVEVSLSDYKKTIGSRLGISVPEEAGAYKFCDYRPAFGRLHKEYVRNYDFFGFTDLDVIYGDIRGLYDKTILDGFDAFSTHATQVSGHLFLMRNTREMRNAFMSVPTWRDKYLDHRNTGFDEQDFYQYFKRGRSRFSQLTSFNRRRPYFFREAYSTPLPASDMRWYWKNGLLSNETYPNRFFLYLHFMVWHSNKWYPYLSNITPGTPAPWQKLTEVVQMDWRRAQEEGFMISPAGIQTIEVRPYP